MAILCGRIRIEARGWFTRFGVCSEFMKEKKADAGELVGWWTLNVEEGQVRNAPTVDRCA